MKDKVFLDTNIWVYNYSDEPKSTIAKKVIGDNFEQIIVSTQVLNELFNVLAVKLKVKTKESGKEVLEYLIKNFAISLVTEETILLGIDIAIKYHYRYFDALMIASALEAGCTILYSEDMHHGQITEDRLKIINPFLSY